MIHDAEIGADGHFAPRFAACRFAEQHVQRLARALAFEAPPGTIESRFRERVAFEVGELGLQLVAAVDRTAQRAPARATPWRSRRCRRPIRGCSTARPAANSRPSRRASRSSSGRGRCESPRPRHTRSATDRSAASRHETGRSGRCAWIQLSISRRPTIRHEQSRFIIAFPLRATTRQSLCSQQTRRGIGGKHIGRRCKHCAANVCPADDLGRPASVLAWYWSNSV